MDVGGALASMALSGGFTAADSLATTNVQIMPGLVAKESAGRLGGNIPHIALWDDNGNRIGQFHPKEGSYIDGLGDGPDPIGVVHNQNGNKAADAYYAMLSNTGHDAICIAAVTVGDKWQTTIWGDTGHKCGQSWFLSQNPIGEGLYKPKCVWLDGDHTNDINAQAMSFHINDLNPTKEKLAQYQKMPATYCGSTPRYSFWGNMEPDSEIPFFNPPLKYLPGAGGTQGGDVHPHAVIDTPGQYDKSVYLYSGKGTNATVVDKKPKKKPGKGPGKGPGKEPGRKPERRPGRGPGIEPGREPGRESGREPGRMPGGKTGRRPERRPGVKRSSRGSNHNPEHLIVTEHPYDDVREVCEHPNSYGFDIASTVQNLYCDMEHKQLYRICTHPKDDDNCFHLDKKVIIPPGGIYGPREQGVYVPPKNYTTVARWTK